MYTCVITHHEICDVSHLIHFDVSRSTMTSRAMASRTNFGKMLVARAMSIVELVGIVRGPLLGPPSS